MTDDRMALVELLAKLFAFQTDDSSHRPGLEWRMAEHNSYRWRSVAPIESKNRECCRGPGSTRRRRGRGTRRRSPAAPGPKVRRLSPLGGGRIRTSGLELQAPRGGAKCVDSVDFLSRELPIQLSVCRVDYFADYEHTDLAISAGENRYVIGSDYGVVGASSPRRWYGKPR
jgi:hypothetical protein